MATVTGGSDIIYINLIPTDHFWQKQRTWDTTDDRCYQLSTVRESVFVLSRREASQTFSLLRTSSKRSSPNQLFVS